MPFMVQLNRAADRDVVVSFSTEDDSAGRFVAVINYINISSCFFTCSFSIPHLPVSLYNHVSKSSNSVNDIHKYSQTYGFRS